MAFFQRPFVALLLLTIGLCIAPASAWGQAEQGHGGSESRSRFSEEPLPLADVPQRPSPILELGEPFLGTGTLDQGFQLPTGAVWQPQFLAFGTWRTAAQGASQGATDFVEATSRFDLFGNLYLTQTERILVGLRPLDDDGQFTRYTLHRDPTLPDSTNGFQHELNATVRTLFFEGDFGELFPVLDPDDSDSLDIYFSVGRQPLSFQDGLLLNENAIDMVGLTRANMKPFELVNTRATGVFGWGDIDRLNRGDKSAKLFGLFTETDTRERTIELDAVVVSADSTRGDGLYFGLGSTRRIGRLANNTFRVVGSYPLGDETAFTRKGVLLHNQFGWTPVHTHNWVYVNVFGGVGKFRSAARSPAAGGPLGQTGVLFAAVGLGRYGAALGNRADNAVGGGVGYQMFFDHDRKQLLLEGGGRYTYDKAGALGGRDALAIGARYQMALGRRFVLELSGFGSYTLSTLPSAVSALDAGGRLEVTVKL